MNNAGSFDTDNTTVCVQQIISGAGTFNGSPVGYARYAYSAAAALTVRCRHWGTWGNNLKFEMIKPASDLGACVVRFDPGRLTLSVLLKTAAGVITATAQNVVDAINAFRIGGVGPANGDVGATTFPNVGSKPFAAGVVTAGTVAALAATSFTGGLDPDTDVAGVWRFTPAAAVNGGMFFFDQKRPVMISSITGRLSASGVSVVAKIVNVTRALTAITNEDVAVWEPSATVDSYFAFEDMKTPVMPGQALIVTCGAANGMVRVTARPESARSYL